jgi:hypothetical protein
MTYSHHGYTINGERHPVYNLWINMRDRCRNPNRPDYERYGNRGISVCKEWENNSKIFIEWALSNGYKKGLLLDRIDNDLGYFPANCRFVDYGVSNRNTRLLRINNTTGYRGVSFHKNKKKWCALICINRKLKHLGCFDSPRLAAIRYDVEAFLLNDERPMNFIDNNRGS